MHTRGSTLISTGLQADGSGCGNVAVDGSGYFDFPAQLKGGQSFSCARKLSALLPSLSAWCDWLVSFSLLFYILENLAYRQAFNGESLSCAYTLFSFLALAKLNFLKVKQKTHPSLNKDECVHTRGSTLIPAGSLRWLNFAVTSHWTAADTRLSPLQLKGGQSFSCARKLSALLPFLSTGLNNSCPSHCF